jgi:hypothetical protein
VYIGLNKSVRFAGCSIPKDWTYRIESDDSRASGYPTHGIVGFEGCVIPVDLSSKITLTHSFGRAYARDCHTRQDSLSPREATNFDLNGFNDMLGDVGSIIKVAVLKPSAVFPFPAGASAASYEQTLKLPVGATIRSIQLYRPGGTGSGAAYQLHVGKDDKSVIYASSTLATDNDPAVIHADVFRVLGSSDRTIRLWANPVGATLVTGGYGIVEYY